MAFARTRLRFDPDLIQQEVLRSTANRGILNCTRQWGKSTVIAAKVAHRVFTRPGSLVVVASPTIRQSSEWMLRARSMLRQLGTRVRKDEANKISAILPNGSRIVGLPGVPENVRSFAGLSMLVIDEAAFVSDEMFHALTPMLATTNGDMWLMSTPNGKNGFFYDSWQNGGDRWHRILVKATDCPRISREFLDAQLAELGRDVFGREFLCEFLGSGANAFERELIESAFVDIVEAFDRQTLLRAQNFLSSRLGQLFYVAVDLGKKHDYSTIVIAEGYGDELHIHYVERIPLGTPYTRVAEIIKEIVQSPLLRNRCALVVDASGVGEPVVDMLRRADLGCRLTAVNITGGRSSTSKHNLMTTLLLALENGHLKIARGMPNAAALINEFLTARMSGDSPAHDDMVMAIALAVWKSKRGFNDRGSGGFI